MLARGLRLQDENPLEMTYSSWPPTSPDSQGNRNDTYKAISPEYRTETHHKLRKLIPTVQALVEEIRDKELGEVLTAVAAKVTL